MSEIIADKPTFANRIVAFSGSTARQSWKIAQELVAKQREKARIRRLSEVDGKYHALDRFRPLLDPVGMKKLDTFYEVNREDPNSLDAYFSSQKYEKLLSLADRIERTANEDWSSASPTHVFIVSSDLLISTVEAKAFENFTRTLVRQYKTSASGNALLTGVLAGSRNYGMAALSAAEGISNSYQAGAYNSEVRQAFEHGFRCINFRNPASDLSDGHKYFLRAAYRLLSVGLGDRTALKRAYFALIYNNGNCLLEMSTIPSNFRNAVLCEFKEAFGNIISTPSHAAATIKDVCERGSISENLFSCSDIRPWLRSKSSSAEYWPA